jgi:hypothetical protein
LQTAANSTQLVQRVPRHSSFLKTRLGLICVHIHCAVVFAFAFTVPSRSCLLSPLLPPLQSLPFCHMEQSADALYKSKPGESCLLRNHKKKPHTILSSPTSSYAASAPQIRNVAHPLSHRHHQKPASWRRGAGDGYGPRHVFSRTASA